jgi:hypothetical protein
MKYATAILSSIVVGLLPRNAMAQQSLTLSAADSASVFAAAATRAESELLTANSRRVLAVTQDTKRTLTPARRRAIAGILGASDAPAVPTDGIQEYVMIGAPRIIADTVLINVEVSRAIPGRRSVISTGREYIIMRDSGSWKVQGVKTISGS